MGRKCVARLLIVFAGLLPQVSVVLAQLPRTQPDQTRAPQIQIPLQGNNDEDLRFFSGEISSNNDGEYVLEGASPRGPYFLDDQKSARRYEGKHVRVIGVLEQASNTIHVRKIEEAAAA